MIKNENNVFSFLFNLFIYFACLSVCLFVYFFVNIDLKFFISICLLLWIKFKMRKKIYHISKTFLCTCTCNVYLYVFKHCILFPVYNTAYISIFDCTIYSTRYTVYVHTCTDILTFSLLHILKILMIELVI